MPKRRRDDFLEKLEEKVRRLERKVENSATRSPPRRRRRRDRSRTRSSSSSSRSCSSQSMYSQRSNFLDDSRSLSKSPLIVIETEEAPEVPQHKDAVVVVDTATENKADAPVAQVDEELSEELLALLGEAPVEITYGPKLMDQLRSRWQEIIKKGLNKEDKDKIMKKYPVPENCKTIDAPKMNREAQAAAEETLVSRDKAIEHKQRGVSCALTAIGLALNKLCKAPGNEEVITLISDSARLLCDYQHRESQLRKMFIISGLNNKTARDTLKDTKVDQWLFGEDLCEKLKASKAIERSSKDLRVSNRPKKNQMGNLNYRGPVNNTYKPRTQTQKRQYLRKPGNISAKPHQQKGRTQRLYTSRHHASRH